VSILHKVEAMQDLMESAAAAVSPARSVAAFAPPMHSPGVDGGASVSYVATPNAADAAARELVAEVASTVRQAMGRITRQLDQQTELLAAVVDHNTQVSQLVAAVSPSRVRDVDEASETATEMDAISPAPHMSVARERTVDRRPPSPSPLEDVYAEVSTRPSRSLQMPPQQHADISITVEAEYQEQQDDEAEADAEYSDVDEDEMRLLANASDARQRAQLEEEERAARSRNTHIEDVSPRRALYATVDAITAERVAQMQHSSARKSAAREAAASAARSLEAAGTESRQLHMDGALAHSGGHSAPRTQTRTDDADGTEEHPAYIVRSAQRMECATAPKLHAGRSLFSSPAEFVEEPPLQPHESPARASRMQSAVQSARKSAAKRPVAELDRSVNDADSNASSGEMISVPRALLEQLIGENKSLKEQLRWALSRGSREVTPFESLCV
jgi:hypothetical protein